MSWDVNLEYKGMLPGGHCPTCTTNPYIDCGNYTWNVSPMFVLAFKNKKGLDIINNEPAFVAADMLGAAINRMIESRETYEKLNPENGWGSYDGAVMFLQKIREKCVEHPNLTVNLH